MTVLTVAIVDQVFDKKSSEVAYLSRVLRQMADEVQRKEGTSSGSQNVLGVNAAGVANSVLATWTYVASGSNP